jgi:hypothetical protein
MCVYFWWPCTSGDCTVWNIIFVYFYKNAEFCFTLKKKAVL